MSRIGRTSGLMSISAAAMLSSIAGSGNVLNSRGGATITLDLSKVIDTSLAEYRTHKDKADEIVAKVVHEDRDFTPDETKALEEHQGKMAAASKRAELIKRQVEAGAISDRKGETRTTPRDQDPTRKGAGREAGEDGLTDEQRDARQAHRRAFNMYLRVGMANLPQNHRDVMMGHQTAIANQGETPVNLDDSEARDLSAIIGAAGGYTCPPETVQAIDVGMKDYAGILNTRATQIATSTGNDLPWPTVNDTGNTGEQVEENQTQNTDTALNTAFGQTMMKAYLFSSKLVLIPVALLQDSAFDIESLITGMLAERLGRITNTRWTTGNGANQPLGIVTGSGLGKQVASGTAITFEELIDLQHSVDPAYRGQAEFMFHDLTFAALRKLKDSDGRPIWQPAATSSILGSGAPGTLLGARYTINNNMAQMASGAKSIVWGDFSRFKIRRVKGVTLLRLTERYAEKLQMGFFAFLRCDSRTVDATAASGLSGAIRHILHP